MHLLSLSLIDLERMTLLESMTLNLPVSSPDIVDVRERILENRPDLHGEHHEDGAFIVGLR